MRIWGMTDIGLVRKENQDAYAVRELDGASVCVVCDGMGGTSGGRLASSVAVETFVAEIENRWKAHMTQEQLQQTIVDSVDQVNQAIRTAAQAHDGYEHMGTTLVAAIAQGDRAVLCNVGDSRAYRISENGIEQITHDHSLVETLVERGELTPEEAKHHPQRNLITRALGTEELVEVDTFPIHWDQGEFLLLCSDGLVNTVSDQEMLFEVIHEENLDGCLDRLLLLAKDRGAPDNVTAILMRNI